jgi:hypothetical protein
MPRRNISDERRRPQHSKNRKRPRRWHRGLDQDHRYLKALGRLAA